MVGVDLKEIYTNYSREVKVLIILVVFLIFNKFLDIILKKFFDSRLQNIPDEKIKKIRTIFSILLSIKHIVLWTIAFLIILSLYKIKLTAILTGFGIIGVIIGLASQTIITDIISGIAIILDRFFYIGDRVKIGDVEGEVIDITLKRTLIKDNQGYIHSIPNSQIKLISKKE
jgi:small conductance mechanosensitive channel